MQCLESGTHIPAFCEAEVEVLPVHSLTNSQDNAIAFRDGIDRVLPRCCHGRTMVQEAGKLTKAILMVGTLPHHKARGARHIFNRLQAPALDAVGSERSDKPESDLFRRGSLFLSGIWCRDPLCCLPRFTLRR